MMQGTYKFIEQGKVIAVQSNLITTLGKREILKFMARVNTDIARSMAVGISATAPVVTDDSLGFEVARAPISIITHNMVDNTFTMKTTLSDNTAATLYEVGTYASYDAYAQQTNIILGFNQATDPWSSGTWVTSGARLGIDALQIAPNASSTVTTLLSGVSLDMSKYADNQEFQFALNSANTNISSIVISFMNNASNYYSFTISGIGSGYKVMKFLKSASASVGAPSWSNITQVQVSATASSVGSASVMLDGLKADIKDTAINNVLISHAVFGTPIIKTSGIPIDIEYTLGLGIV